MSNLELAFAQPAPVKRQTLHALHHAEDEALIDTAHKAGCPATAKQVRAAIMILIGRGGFWLDPAELGEVLRDSCGDTPTYPAASGASAQNASALPTPTWST